MAKNIIIMDTTLRDGEQSPGCSMNIAEKKEMALQLEKMGVDIIEAGFAIASPGDFASVEAIAKIIKNAKVQSLSRSKKIDIEASYNALKSAVSPIIHIFIATSPIHMEYKLKMQPDEVIKLAGESVAYAKSLCSEVEFSAEDASRSDLPFLAKVFDEVIAKGATTINIPDTVGYCTPNEMNGIIKYLYENVTGIEKVNVSVHCHNDLGLAVANSLSCIQAGANQVECTLNGIGERAGNASLEEVVMNLKVREDIYNAKTRIDSTQIYRSSQLLTSLIGVPTSPTKPIVGANVFSHESGIHQHGVLANKSTYEIMSPESVGVAQNQLVLGKHSGKHAFEDRLKNMGYDATAEEIEEYFTEFKKLADKKKNISVRDIEAIIHHKKVGLTGTYSLDRFVINSGNTITATANIRVKHGDEIIEKVSVGDGPIDAAFKAVNEIVGNSITLLDYSLNSVTEGQDALGEALVKIERNEHIATGRSVSTDIVESTINAYLNAINRVIEMDN